MTNRIPLIVNSSTAQIDELPAGDNLDLGQSSIVGVGNLTAAGNAVVGNIKTDGYYYANGTPVTFGGGANIDLTAVTTNVIPASNVTFSLGNATNQWLDLWVSNATIYLNSIPLGVGNTGVLQFAGNDIVTSGPNVINTGNVETTGDVVGGNVVIATGGALTFADGSIQTSAYGDANVSAYLPGYTGNLNNVGGIYSTHVSVSGNIQTSELYVANFEATGNLNVTGSATVGNLTAQNVYGNLIESNSAAINGNLVFNQGYLTNAGNLIVSSIQRNQNPPLGTESLGIEMLTQITDDAGIYSSVSAGPSYAGIKSSNAGNADVLVQGGYGATIKTSNVSGGDIKEWSFLASGNTITPGNVSVNGNVSSAGNITSNFFIGDGSQLTGLPAQYGNANVEAYLPTSNVIISINSNVANTDGNVANLTTSLSNTNSELANVSNAVITLSQATTDAFANTNGNVANLTITVNDQANAIGNLQGATYANANVAAYLPTYTGNISAGNVAFTGNLISTSQVFSLNWGAQHIDFSQYNRIEVYSGDLNVYGNVTANVGSFFKGDGSQLSNITGANVTGEVALANTVSNPLQPNITALGTITSLTANAINVNGIFTANGNAQFNQDVYFAGNVTIPGNITQITGNSGSFFGNAVTGFGALYAGLPAGYTLLNNEVVQFSDSYDGYTQVSHRNINGGSQATTDYVATADNGDDTINYVDLGVAGSGYNGALANNSLGTSLYANDSYLYARGNVAGGNLVIGSNQANGVVRVIAGGVSNIGDVVATFSTNGLSLTGSISNDSVASPAPSISGFAFFGSTVSAAGNVTGAYIKGNGSELTSLPAPTVTQDITTVGDMSIMTYDGNVKYVSYATVEPSTGNLKAGNISTTGNATANYFIGDGSQLTNIPTGLANAIVNGNSNVSISTAGGSITAGVGGLAVMILGQTTVALGYRAGQTPVAGTDSQIAIGREAGRFTQGLDAIAIGTRAGRTGQLQGATAIGGGAGGLNQGIYATALGGFSTGFNNQGQEAIAIGGVYAGEQSQGNNAIAIGSYAGNFEQGANAIAIGSYAGRTSQPANSIIINASSLDLEGTNSGLYIAPVRNDTGNVTNVVYYNTDTKEVTYGPVSGPSVDSIITAASIAPAATNTQYNVTALAESATIAAPTGSPADGAKLTIRILDNGTAQTLTWNAIYQVIGTTLPTTTVSGKTVYVGCIYNESELTWDVVSVAQQA